VERLVRILSGMVARRYQDLIAWQTAEGFKAEVFRIVLASARACADLDYKDQLFAAATSLPANIAEGFVRKSPGDFHRFLRISLGSLVEAEVRLRDGIALAYFTEKDCALAFRFGRRCAVASTRLANTQLALRNGRRGPRT
jgi:four helix bundle protein